MTSKDVWLLGDLFRLLGLQRDDTSAFEGKVSALDQLKAASRALMNEGGEPTRRAIAQRALDAYSRLSETERLQYFEHLIAEYGVNADDISSAHQAWRLSGADDDLAWLFRVVEPDRQELFRRLNHASGATLTLVEMRAHLRALKRQHPHLKAVDRDFHHVLASWFNRGFLSMERITRDSPRKVRERFVAYDTVHPIRDLQELRTRLHPRDRRCYAFFHPATGDVPLIFVEVALTDSVATEVDPILERSDSVSASRANTAVLYSINNSLDGLAGISFGDMLIKQVIEEMRAELPRLTTFVTLSPIPGFRSWLSRTAQEEDDVELTDLVERLSEVEEPEALAKLGKGDLRVRVERAVAQYLASEKRADGTPVDPVARFHLGNGATAWQVNWPASQKDYSWEQSFGAMVNYRYEPDLLEQHHERFVRHGEVALSDSFRNLLAEPEPSSVSASRTAPIDRVLSRASDSENNHQPKEDDPSMAFTQSTIYKAFLASVERHPDKPLFELQSGRKISYADTLATTRKVAATLIDDGVAPGDRVAMQVEKSPEAIALYLATLQIGGVFLPLNPAYTGSEVDFFIEDASPRVLVVDPARADDNAHRSATLTVETLGTTGEGTLLRGSDVHPGGYQEVHPSTREDPASILYTSGTTGRSKGAVLTHGNLASNCSALLEAWEYTGEDRLIHALPIFHIHGLFVATNMTLAAGATMLWLPKFDLERVLDLIPTATVLMGVPTFYTRLLSSDRLTAEHCSSMRLFVSGSAPLLPADHETFEQRTGHAILERYGMTETGMNTTNPYRNGPRKPGTVGLPFPGVEIRITEHESGKQTPAGEVGLVEVRGPNVFSGYWKMPDKTAQEFRSDGFFITGDLGRIDDGGYLAIVGRDKDLIISGGLNVYPKEIEEHLDDHEDVSESAVVGVADPDFGETVVAVIVTNNDVAPEEGELEGRLQDHVKDQLARFKQPRAYRFVDELPRNVMGKVQKAELRKRFGDLFHSQVS